MCIPPDFSSYSQTCEISIIVLVSVGFCSNGLSNNYWARIGIFKYIDECTKMILLRQQQLVRVSRPVHAYMYLCDKFSTLTRGRVAANECERLN